MIDSRAAPCCPEAIRPTTSIRRRALLPPNQLITGARFGPVTAPEARAAGAGKGRGASRSAPHRPMPAAQATMARA